MGDDNAIPRWPLWPYVAVALVFLTGASVFAGVQWWRQRPPQVSAEVCAARRDASTSLRALALDDLTDDLRDLSEAANRDDVDEVTTAATDARVSWAQIAKLKDNPAAATTTTEEEVATHYATMLDALAVIARHCGDD